MSVSKTNSAKTPRKTKGARTDVVIRVSKGNHDRLKALIRPVAGRKGVERSESVNECLERLLDAADALSGSQTLYVLGISPNISAYESLAEARGEAIMTAARSQTPVVWPKIAIVIGEDQV